MNTQHPAPFTTNNKSIVKNTPLALAQRLGFTEGALEALEIEVESCKQGLIERTRRVHKAQLESEITMLVQLAQYYANCIRDPMWLDLTYQQKLDHAREQLINPLKLNDSLKSEAGRLLTYAILPFNKEGTRPTLLEPVQFDEFCHEVQRAHPDIFEPKEPKKRALNRKPSS
jgi:hypothetical protein